MEAQTESSCDLLSARAAASEFQSHLKKSKQKQLGQFFTGLPLARLLAALACPGPVESVLDPMAGHGDLLDAVLERCAKQGSTLRCVDAIDIDKEAATACESRMAPWGEIYSGCRFCVSAHSAFVADAIESLGTHDYDLVITNPPYVRYQRSSNRMLSLNSQTEIRKELLRIAEARTHAEWPIWQEIICGYSGLSDLSVPSWILSAMLVKPGGRLAVVAPATWQSRNYALPIKYLLARFFQIETIVEDRQPGWFSEALVRTNLVVARRLETEAAQTPLEKRDLDSRFMLQVSIDSSAAGGSKESSLVAGAYAGSDPEGSFSKSLQIASSSADITVPASVFVTRRGLREEAAAILRFASGTTWIRKLEIESSDLPLFSRREVDARHLVPPQILSLLPRESRMRLVELPTLGIEVSQGLRTGCNGFFYVDLITEGECTSEVRSSSLLGSRTFEVPTACLKPVLRRQSELREFQSSQLRGRVLDLREWILPEDEHLVASYAEKYRASQRELPQVMPVALAEYVRAASDTYQGDGDRRTRIPELSAVRTNSRTSNRDGRLAFPRFWYMLPDFMPRHQPGLFVGRVNQGIPRVHQNYAPPILIDANFSTMWSSDKHWDLNVLQALLNSSWVAACMESIGTPMGGGALKLEATQIRRIPVPPLDDDAISKLNEVIKKGIGGVGAAEGLNDVVDPIVCHGIYPELSGAATKSLSGMLYEYAQELAYKRQRNSE